MSRKDQISIEIPFRNIREICRRYQVRQMALFGSVVRDDFSQYSDIDILVEFLPEAELGYSSFYVLQQELCDLFKRPVDLVPKTGLKPIVKKRIENTLWVIYESR